MQVNKLKTGGNMKKIIYKLSFIISTTFFSYHVSACHNYPIPSYKTISQPQDNFIHEEYTDNIKNKQGNLIKINYRVISKEIYNNKKTNYSISVFYGNGWGNEDKVIRYNIEDIPINNKAGNDIYLPIINNNKLLTVMIDSGFSYNPPSIFLTDDNHGGKLKPAVKGQEIRFKNKYIEADISICFDPIALYVKQSES